MNWKPLLCSLLLALPATADEFQAANALYDAGKFAEAIAAYEKIEPKSAHIFYNLGNAYYREGQAGRAVLNYERARQLAPRDPDVLANLKFAQQRLGVEEINTSPQAARRFLHAAVWSRTVNEWANYELAGVWLTAIALGLCLGLSRWRTVFLVGAVAAFLWLAATAGALAYRVTVQRHSPPAIVLVNHTDARFAPLPDATVHFKLDEGTKVAVKESRGAWLFVERADGSQGWVRAETVERIGWK